MAQATAPNTTALSVSEAAAAIVRLINSSPRSPRPEEIEAVIAKAVVVSAMPPLPPEHLEYRRLVAEIEQMHARDEEEEEALTLASDRAMAMEDKVWSQPARTLADVLFRGEIALYNENGVMEYLDRSDGYYDERSVAQLIRAVVDVLGGRHA